MPRKPPTCGYCREPGHTRTTCVARYVVDDNSGQSDGMGRKKRHRFGEYINSSELNPQGVQGESAMRHTHQSQFHKAHPHRKSSEKQGTSETQ